MNKAILTIFLEVPGLQQIDTPNYAIFIHCKTCWIEFIISCNDKKMRNYVKYTLQNYITINIRQVLYYSSSKFSGSINFLQQINQRCLQSHRSSQFNTTNDGPPRKCFNNDLSSVLPGCPNISIWSIQPVHSYISFIDVAYFSHLRAT